MYSDDSVVADAVCLILTQLVTDAVVRFRG